MAKPNPMISTDSTTEDLAADNSLRPKTLKDYQGQASVHEQMEIFIGAARKRAESLDHVLIFGPHLGRVRKWCRVLRYCRCQYTA